MKGTVASLASQMGTWGLPEQFLRSNAEGEALPFQHRFVSILSHIPRRRCHAGGGECAGHFGSLAGVPSLRARSCRGNVARSRQVCLVGAPMQAHRRGRMQVPCFKCAHAAAASMLDGSVR